MFARVSCRAPGGVVVHFVRGAADCLHQAVSEVRVPILRPFGAVAEIG